jgi:predicted MFS family arabinose efflux permease
VGRGPWLWVGAVSWLVLFYRIGLDNVLLVSLRQQITPDHLLGRMNATMRFVMTGAFAVGAALAGAIGQYADVRTAVRVAAIGLALSWIPRAFSPMRLSRRRPPARHPRVPTCRPGR